jgi:hypothetical protein
VALAPFVLPRHSATAVVKSGFDGDGRIAQMLETPARNE